jgi:arylsulfatase A-like enzyme
MSFDGDSFVESMEEQGYDTRCFSMNSLLSPMIGFDRGFKELLVENEVFLERRYGGGFEAWEELHSRNYDSDTERYVDFFKLCLEKKEFNSLKLGIRQLYEIFNPFYFGNKDYMEDEGAEELNRLVQKKISDSVEDPFFLYLNYMEVHGYDAPRDMVDGSIDYGGAKQVLNSFDFIPDIGEEEKRLVTGLYDGQIKYTDHKIRQMVQEVREKHPDTVFIFTSDHGQNSGHYGMWDHQYGVWERLIRVPLIIWGEDIPGMEIE